jgi:hypothetical protein
MAIRAGSCIEDGSEARPSVVILLEAGLVQREGIAWRLRNAVARALRPGILHQRRRVEPSRRLGCSLPGPSGEIHRNDSRHQRDPQQRFQRHTVVTSSWPTPPRSGVSG